MLLCTVGFWLAALDPSSVARLLNLPLSTPQPRLPAARLTASLQGTLVATDERYSLALVDGRTVFVGEQVDGRRIHAIVKGCLVFEGERLCVRPLTLPVVAAPGQGNAEFKRVALADFAQWTQVRIVPVPNGFKVFNIPKGSIYETLGVRSGDIVRTVNDRPVDFSVLPLIRPGAQLTVELERDGSRYTLQGQLD